MKKATVVIPNWNGMKFLKACLDSLLIQDTDDFEVLMIDNASEDGSAEFVRAEYSSVRVDVMPENLGFAGGVNEGILRSETPYVILLNNDTECAPGFVRALIAAADRDPRIFSVSARMVNFYDRTLMDDAGDLYTVLGWGAQRGVGQPVSDRRYGKPKDVFSACGGAALYRREIFSEIGLFDPDHFAYLEDIDVGYRARIYGYRNVYEPDAWVYHVGSGTSGSKYNDFKVRLSSRNALYLVYKNMPLFQRIVNAPALALGRQVKKRFFSKLGFSEAYNEGIQEAKAKRGDLKIVPYTKAHLPNYLRIEAELIGNTAVYVTEFLRRHMPGRKKRDQGQSA
ncbi:MAG: glycosyltransferase family 2 protein [Lachnospiraceae bacterium]|nr:glycosyltransferase family 2 protein [Lachnospiraceae bacterium]